MDFTDYLQKSFPLDELEAIVLGFFPHKVVVKKGGIWDMSPRSFVLSNFGHPRARFAMRANSANFSLRNINYGDGYKYVDDGTYVIDGAHNHFYFNDGKQAVEFKLIYG